MKKRYVFAKKNVHARDASARWAHGHRIREMAQTRLLGNAIISKKILRTRKIMVMHSNERGECHPSTLVDR